MTTPELVVTTPRSRVTERDYVLGVVLREFLGLSFRLERHDRNIVTLCPEGAEGIIEIPDLLFSVPENQWKTAASLPLEPVTRLTTGDHEKSLPALFCDEGNGAVIVGEGDSLRLRFDLFGSCFYLLTRYEEHVADAAALDAHGRFPARRSLLAREDLLERPLADEYLAILRTAMNRLWPGCAPPSDDHRLIVTHDIDHPVSTYGQALRLVARRALGDLLRRRDLPMACRRIRAYVGKDVDADPNNTFDWLMDRSEEIDVVSRFHFMAAAPTRYDSGYDIGAPYLQAIFRRIAERGHEIGLHPSYQVSDKPTLFATEKERLEQALQRAGIGKWSCTSRQHYLRWNAQSTWYHLDAIGIRIDSSLGFADAPGFRCGTSRSFSTFDLSRCKTLGLIEQPLIVMDATLTGKGYLGLDWEHAMQKACDLATICRQFAIPFTLLWHNDKVLTEPERRQYAEVLRTCA